MRYYDNFPEREDGRLDSFCRVEFEITKRAILESLQGRAGLTILDIGGGTGAYSFWLRSLGHHVTLIDRSQSLIELAKENCKLELSGGPDMRIEVGDAMDLSHLESSSFDIILSLGPQYHLHEEQDVQASLRELKRLARADAVLFSAFLHRMGTLRWFWNKRPDLYHEHLEFFEDFRQNGYFPEVEWSTFNTYRAYFPDQIRELMEQAGFRTQRLLNCEAFGGNIGTADLPSKVFDQLMDHGYARAEDPEAIHLAEHFLWVGNVHRQDPIS